MSLSHKYDQLYNSHSYKLVKIMRVDIYRRIFGNKHCHKILTTIIENDKAVTV